jgi:hypothetical protein
MFKKFKDLFRSMPQPIAFAERNRQRFNSIISDKRCNFLEEIYKRLLANDTTLTDKQILDSYYKFSDNIQTNTIAAAELEWVIISVICFYRQHLTEELLRRGLLCIVYSWGDTIDSNEVFEFIQQQILAVDVSPYGGLPPEVGMKWLTGMLLSQKGTVQKVLEDVIKQNRIELDQP